MQDKFGLKPSTSQFDICLHWYTSLMRSRVIDESGPLNQSDHVCSFAQTSIPSFLNI